MSAAEPEPIAEDDPIWDNITAIFSNMTQAVDAVRPRPVAQQRRELPNDEDIGELESRYADLSYAETDEEKVAALKSITLWLAQWKF